MAVEVVFLFSVIHSFFYPFRFFSFFSQPSYTTLNFVIMMDGTKSSLNG